MSEKDIVEEEIEYITRVDVNIAILREIERINFREKMRILMPLVAQQLADAGVDFSSAHFDGPVVVEDEDIDQVFDFWSSHAKPRQRTNSGRVSGGVAGDVSETLDLR